MQVGKVKWYDCKKGYGFIVSEDGADVLAHFTAIEGDGFRRLFDGEPVEYKAERTAKGLQATWVRRIDPEFHRRRNQAAPKRSDGTLA